MKLRMWNLWLVIGFINSLSANDGLVNLIMLQKDMNNINSIAFKSFIEQNTRFMSYIGQLIGNPVVMQRKLKENVGNFIKASSAFREDSSFQEYFKKYYAQVGQFLRQLVRENKVNNNAFYDLKEIIQNIESQLDKIVGYEKELATWTSFYAQVMVNFSLEISQATSVEQVVGDLARFLLVFFDKAEKFSALLRKTTSPEAISDRLKAEITLLFQKLQLLAQGTPEQKNEVIKLVQNGLVLNELIKHFDEEDKVSNEIKELINNLRRDTEVQYSSEVAL